MPESGKVRSAMLSTKPYEIVVIGAGIVGLATARAIALGYRRSVLVLEAEETLAAHQTGHNSGVIHSGLYYQPGSLKARNCVAGRDEMYRFCEENGVPHENCGKVVVATSSAEVESLRALERRGRANGLTGLRWVDRDGLQEHEPHVSGVAGLLVPETGIVDFSAVAEVMAGQLRERDGEILTGAGVIAAQRQQRGFVLQTSRGAVEARHLINCAGLQCDRVARMCGLEPELRIIPFRGEYFKMVPEKEHLVRNLIYPVPDPRFPFLGVHFTRMVRGGIEAGPNAVLALKREGYGRLSFSPRDSFDIFTYGGFWRLAARFWTTGFGEMYRSFSKSAFVAALRRLIPELTVGDLRRHGAGVRAQAVGRDGALVYDFHILEGERMLHLLNAPSPAATASLCIGRSLAQRAADSFGFE
jgi:L-2-hydroxyglutarate oxidase